MNHKNLQKFLFDSNKAGYASGEEKKWIKEPDNSTTIVFEQGDWKSHDNFFGGEPYGGRVVVFYKKTPYWIMVYYGWVAEKVETNPLYHVLRNALMNMPKNPPLRGPKEYRESNLVYTNNWEGSIEQFAGEEKIRKGSKHVYKANYFGGLVDQREGV